MILEITSPMDNVNEAIEIVNRELKTGMFVDYYGGSAFGEFIPDMSNASLALIVQEMSQYVKARTIQVKKWYPKWRWTSAVAMTYGTSINLNARKLKRPVYDIMETITHETVHIVDHSFLNLSFGHGSNYSKGKDFTAPYLIQFLMRELVEHGRLYKVEELNGLQRKNG